jgi:hypothetical protein
MRKEGGRRMRGGERKGQIVGEEWVAGWVVG